jgi:cholesterol transport system auxiliary component
MRAPSTRLALATAATLLLGACVSLPKPEPVELFTIDPRFEGAPVTAGTGPVLLVSAPRAGPGLDGPGMAWLQRPNQLQYFARSQWVEPPARMVGPALVRALERTGRFRAVTQVALAASPGLRLESEVVRLQQEFTGRPSRVRFTLRLELVDVAARSILGTRELEALEPAPTEDAAGGAAAANAAVKRVLDEAAAWCAEVGGASSAADGGALPGR